MTEGWKAQHAVEVSGVRDMTTDKDCTEPFYLDGGETIAITVLRTERRRRTSSE